MEKRNAVKTRTNQMLLHCLKQLVSWEFVPAVLSSSLLLSAVTDDWDESNLVWWCSSVGKAFWQSGSEPPLRCCCSGLAA